MFWILTNSNPNYNPSPNLNYKGIEMLFGNVHPYLAFDYAAPAMDSIVPVQAKVISGASDSVPLVLTVRVSRESKRENVP